MTAGILFTVAARDLKLARRRRIEALLPVVFFVVAASLYPFGVGPELQMLREIASGIVWVCALLAAMLSLNTLYVSDYADGSLEQMVLSRESLVLIAAGKALAHWVLTGLPLILASPLIGLFFGMASSTIAVMTLTLLLGTPVLSLLGSVGAALTLGLRSGGVLILLLVLPLCIPVLIFGAGAVTAVDAGLSAQGHLSLLGALLLVSGLGAPWATAAALRELNLRELEQLVEQLNRLPSRQAQLELVPGEQVGGSRVQLQGQRSKPWRVSLARHNDGQLSTGEQQWGLGLDWDSPLGLADQLSLRAGRDAVSDSFRHSHNQSLNYSLPYGWWTFNYSYSQSYYRTESEANGFAFDQDGDSKTHALRAERVLHRDSLSKTAASIGVSHLRSNNFILGNLIDVSSQRLSEAQFGFNHGRRIGSAFVNADLGWQHGTGAFDAQRSGNPQGGQPVARYNKYSLTLSYLQPFQLWGESFSFDSLANGQRSEDVLFSPQRTSLGGQSSIRGYKDQTLSGDSGGYWRNDLRWSRPVTLSWLRPAFAEYGASLGYDQGVIRGDRYNADQHGRMSSNSLEVFARGEHLAASVTFAHSLERPAVLTEREAPIYFRVDFLL